MITMLICKSPELELSVSEECLRFQKGDIIKLALKRSDALDQQKLVELEEKGGEGITLYRNSIWLNFEVMDREFFLVTYLEKRKPESCAVCIRPISSAVHSCLEMILAADKKTA